MTPKGCFWDPASWPVVRHSNTFHAARAPAPAAPAPAAPAAPGGPHTELEHTPPASGPYPMIPPLNEAEMLADLTDPGEDDTATA